MFVGLETPFQLVLIARKGINISMEKMKLRYRDGILVVVNDTVLAGEYKIPALVDTSHIYVRQHIFNSTQLEYY